MEAEEDVECSICMDHSEEERNPLLNCIHVFHEGCIMEWWRQQGRAANCPICRASLYPEYEGASDDSDWDGSDSDADDDDDDDEDGECDDDDGYFYYYPYNDNQWSPSVAGTAYPLHQEIDVYMYVKSVRCMYRGLG